MNMDDFIVKFAENGFRKTWPLLKQIWLIWRWVLYLFSPWSSIAGHLRQHQLDHMVVHCVNFGARQPIAKNMKPSRIIRIASSGNLPENVNPYTKFTWIFYLHFATGLGCWNWVVPSCNCHIPSYRRLLSRKNTQYKNRYQVVYMVTR